MLLIERNNSMILYYVYTDPSILLLFMFFGCDYWRGAIFSIWRCDAFHNSSFRISVSSWWGIIAPSLSPLDYALTWLFLLALLFAC